MVSWRYFSNETVQEAQLSPRHCVSVALYTRGLVSKLPAVEQYKMQREA